MFDWRVESREKFYHTLVKWWDDWGFPIIPLKSLPETIYVVSYTGVSLYAIPLYRTDSDLCWIGFPTGNKKAPKEFKEKALEFLMEVVEDSAKTRGFKTIITTSATPKLMKLFGDRGFEVSDEGTNYYTKNI